jgi:hypothetical protein
MKNSYLSLAIQTVVSGVIMYLVMFVMIDRVSSFYNNLNMLYMTLMMVAPMVVLMILAMRHMFPSKGVNAVLLAVSAGIFYRVFCSDPHPDDDRRQFFPAIDDPSSCGGNPDVPASFDQRPAGETALWRDHPVATPGDRPDEGHPSAPVNRSR